MTKTLNQIIFFFPPPKSEYFFQQHWESEYFFLEKKPFKLNGRSLTDMIDVLIKRVSVTYKCYEMYAHRGKKVQLLVF